MELTSRDYDLLTASELALRAFAPGYGMPISLAVTVWRLDDDCIYTPTAAALSRFNGQLIDRMAGKIASMKHTRSMTRKFHKAEHNHDGACQGKFLKSAIKDDSMGYVDERALIRIAYHDRLIKGLKRLAKATTNEKPANLDLTKKHGFIDQIDRLKVVDLRDLVWSLEGWPKKPAKMKELLTLNQEQLELVIEYLGPDQTRFYPGSYSENEETPGAAAENSLTAQDPLNEEAPTQLASLAPKSIVGGPESRPTNINGNKTETSARIDLRKASLDWPLRKSLLCVGVVAGLVLTALTATVLTDRGVMTHILRTQGAPKALAYIKNCLMDGKGTHRDRFNFAWASFRNGDVAKAEQLIIELVEDKADPWIIGDCYYLLGLIRADRGDLYQSLGFFFRSRDLLQKM